MRQDIIHSGGKLVVVDGDFVIDESDRQHVEDIIIFTPGEFKRTPAIGFGAIMQLKKNRKDVAFKRDLKVQLEYDGYKNPTIDLSDGYDNLKIDI